ncbi:MAG: hypothetical protein GX568_07495 [Candidatus Gastranaerophilales bacterium]|nr:hypothetical protein [Candidatus Gastranaerophilales bacterium]
MGLFSGTIQLAALQQRELDLEYKIQSLQSESARITEKAINLVKIGEELDPESPEYKKIQQRREKLHLLEKKISQDILRYQTLLKLVETQKETAQKMVDSGIKRLSFNAY